MATSVGAATNSSGSNFFCLDGFGKAMAVHRIGGGQVYTAGTGYPKETTEGIFPVSGGNMAVLLFFSFLDITSSGMDEST